MARTESKVLGETGGKENRLIDSYFLIVNSLKHTKRIDKGPILKALGEKAS